MRDNLSIVITIIVLVLLMVIFPLYNFFERQDDMSYNLVLKATTAFTEEVLKNGYIDQAMYDKFVNQLANTGNMYDIQLEAHRRILTKDPLLSNQDVYTEQSIIDYNKDIFKEMKVSSNLMDKTLKNNVYYLNQKDEFYVKVKNSSTTMAGAIFDVIVPTSKKERIVVNYGGIVKNNAWKKIDATYIGHQQPPSKPKVYLGEGNNKVELKNNDVLSNTALKVTAESVAFSTQLFNNEIKSYNWLLRDVTDPDHPVIKTNGDSAGETKLPNEDFGWRFEAGKKYELTVYAIDKYMYKSDETKINFSIKENEYSVQLLTETDTLAITTGTGMYEPGTNVTINTSPSNAAKYKFEGWYIAGTLVSTNPNYAFTVTENVTITAKYSRIYSEIAYIDDGLQISLDGAKNAGTYHNTSLAVWQSVKDYNQLFNVFGTANWQTDSLVFDGNHYLDLGVQNYDEVTFEFVIKFNQLSPNQTIIGNHNNGGFALVYDGDNFDENKRGSLAFEVFDSTIDKKYQILYSSVGIEADKIYSISCGFSKSNKSMYISVNGNVDSRVYNGIFNLPVNNTPLIVGVDTFGGGVDKNLRAAIYSIRVYNKKLGGMDIPENFEVDKNRFGI